MYGDFEIVVLLTNDMMPVPKSISIREDWGEVDIEDESGNIISGKHVLLKGSEDDVIRWLNSFESGVWINKKGQAPINKQFTLVVGDVTNE